MTAFLSRRRIPALPTFLFLLVLFFPGILRAHARTISYSDWVKSPAGWEVQIRLPLLELDRRFGKGRWGPEAARSFALERFRVGTGGGDCARTWTGGAVQEDDFVARWALDCQGPVRALYLDAFFDTAPSHLHYARVHTDGRVFERVVTAAAPTFSLDGEGVHGTAASLVSGLYRFFSAPARLFFLAGLVLLAASRSSLLKIVGAIAFSLVALGMLRAGPRPVEALMGLSVLVVAVELFIRWSPREQSGRWRLVLCSGLLLTVLPAGLGWVTVAPLSLFGVALICLSFLGLRGPGRVASIPWILAAVFGPIHGLGFAGAVETLGQGTNGGASPAEILGFNLGVIAGEAVLAAVLFLFFSLVFRIMARASWSRPFLQERIAASVILAAGTYGFVACALDPF